MNSARRTLAAALLAAFTVVIDNTKVNVALPTLAAAFAVDETTLQWIVDGEGVGERREATLTFVLSMTTVKAASREVATVRRVLFMPPRSGRRQAGHQSRNRTGRRAGRWCRATASRRRTTRGTRSRRSAAP